MIRSKWINPYLGGGYADLDTDEVHKLRAQLSGKWLLIAIFCTFIRGRHDDIINSETTMVNSLRDYTSIDTPFSPLG